MRYSITHTPAHEYPSVNGPRLAPETWRATVNLEDRVYGPDIVVTVVNARGSIVHMRASVTGPYRNWSEPSAAQRRQILDEVLSSVGRKRDGRVMPASHPGTGWAWDYFTAPAD